VTVAPPDADQRPSSGGWPAPSLRRDFLIFLALAAATLLLRLPTFFEPPWHADEGTFAAVAQKLLNGGALYADAWESKPPLFLYMYAALFKLFGAGVLPLRIAVAVAAIGAQFALFLTARRLLDERSAWLAAAVLTVMLAVPFWDGNLALTESFSLLPAITGVYFLLRGSEAARPDAWMLASGLMFGVAVLIRQPAGAVAAVAVLWLLLTGRPWLRPALLVAAGGAAVVLACASAFALFGSFYWFWNANVEFFFSYIPEAREIPVYERPVLVTPVIAAAAALLYVRRRHGVTPAWSLPALWLAATLAAALLSGRPYEHYLIPCLPPLAITAALLVARAAEQRAPSRADVPALAIAGALAAVWFAVAVPAFGGNLVAVRYAKGIEYYGQFVARLTGAVSERQYEDYFDRRVDLTEKLAARLEQLGARGQGVYIWGEYPWVYALSGSRPATRYVTSFYVLQMPGLAEELQESLEREAPRFVVIMDDAWPKVPDPDGALRWRFDRATHELNQLLEGRYQKVETLGKAQIYMREPTSLDASGR
jgi:4-amino-4-deoxy-L-arabinose transferase-like glycosyltransferase